MDEKLDIVAIGESVIELSSSESLHHAKCLDKYYAGDVLTSAIAASRMGSKVGYITRVGDDYFKNYLLDSWNNEGLDITQVKLVEEDNGLCLIARPTDGNKEFSYYRKKTAATKLSIEDISVDYIKSSKILYSSGMTQSLSLSAKEAVKKAYEIARENGVTTAYDPNFTKRFMTVEAAKENFDEVIQNVDILFLNSNNDAKNLLEIDSYENIIKYSVINTQKEEATFTAVVAVKTADGKLVGVRAANETIAAEGKKEFTVSTTFETDLKNLKLEFYIWDSLESMKNLTFKKVFNK